MLDNFTLNPETRESPDTCEMREALGAVATDGSAVYRLYRGQSGDWRFRRQDAPETGAADPERVFPDRESALKALHLAVVRRAAYCLYLQSEDGRVTRECRNWPPRVTYASGRPASGPIRRR